MGFRHVHTTIERIGHHTEVEQASGGVWAIHPRLVFLVRGYPKPIVMPSSPELALYQVGDEVVVYQNEDASQESRQSSRIMGNATYDQMVRQGSGR